MIELDQLVRFVQHPVRAFLRRRLGVGGTARDDDVEDALSIELDALERWSVAERLLEARLAGADREAAIAAERARGSCLRICGRSRCARTSIRSWSSSSRRRRITFRPRRRAPPSTSGWSYRKVERLCTSLGEVAATESTGLSRQTC